MILNSLKHSWKKDKKGIFVFLFCFWSLVSFSQNQPLADSLKSQYYEQLPDSLKLSYLRTIAVSESSPDSALKYTDQLLRIATKAPYYEHQALLIKGSAYRAKGESKVALDRLFQSVTVAQENNLSTQCLTESYGEISTVYYQSKDFTNATKYVRLAIEEVVKEGLNTNSDSIGLAINYANLAYYYLEADELDSAKKYNDLSALFFDQTNAYALYGIYARGNGALINAKQGRLSAAQNTLNEVIQELEDFGDSFAICDYLGQMANIYLEQSEPELAEEVAERGLALANAHQFKDQQALLNRALADANLAIGNYKAAYNYQEAYHSVRDSLTNADLIRQLADLRTEYEVGQKQSEVDLLTAEKKTQQVVMLAIAVLALVLLVLGIIIYRFYREKSKINVELNRLIQTKDRFFSIISHDLRGPISSFQGVSRMIKFLAIGKQTDQLIELADDVSDSASKLSGLLDNLLTWALQQKGHFPYKPEPVACQSAVQEVLGTLKGTAESKNITLAADVPAELQFWVDRNSTLTIIRNLVNNSIKFTPEGGKIEVKCMAKDAHIQMQVIDTG
ncbi:sensor histidine kinase, partial [Marinoscillum furvescens]|uniref:sensor histidine kinase n=1 Tax=Marinoscillum furvescens TaxID=1026 RepID=UPI0029390DD5